MSRSAFFIAAPVLALLAGCVVKSQPGGQTAGDPPRERETVRRGPPANESPPPARPPKAQPDPEPEPTHAPETYTDSQGTEVRMEAGAAAFADAVVSFEEGKKAAKYDAARDAKLALGPPDYDEGAADDAVAGFVTLGCGGRLTLAFEDVLLADREGPDLHVFEIGPDVESFLVEVSADGDAWKRVGLVEGQPASVDIAEVADPGARYGFIRLTDQKESCGSRWPGADLDAVGVIGP